MNKIMVFPISMLILAACLLACESSNHKWQKVEYNINTYQCSTTECITTHQGKRTIEKAEVYIENDTLVILFPPQLPAYWGCMTIKAHNGLFIAEASGIPFIHETLRYETTKQLLVLDKEHYAIGDTLKAYCDITYKEHNETVGKSILLYFKGSIKEAVRTRNFDPLADENFMQFDLPTAIRELGEPLNDETFNTLALPEFRVELLNLFPPSQDVTIRELTWDSSEYREISDGGVDRLTIWYYCKNGNSWLPVHYMRWDINTQY